MINKDPTYRELNVEKVTNNGSNGINIDFSNCRVSFTIPAISVKKYKLEKLSPGDTIFAKSKLGTEDADFWGINLIIDIKKYAPRQIELKKNRAKNFVHPELRKSELFLGNRVFFYYEENFGLVGEEIGIGTLRIGKISYDMNSGKKYRQVNGTCGEYGPYPMFIKKSEFAKLKNLERGLTIEILSQRIANT